MRRTDKEITDKGLIEMILKKSEICRIGIPVENNVPYIVPLNYGFSDNHLYFHSATQGRKIELLRKNNRVSFEIEYASEVVKGDMPCNWTTKYRSLMGTGTIEILTDVEAIRNGLDIIMEHYANRQKTYEDAYLKRIFILRLNIESITAKQSGEWGLV